MNNNQGIIQSIWFMYLPTVIRDYWSISFETPRIHVAFNYNAYIEYNNSFGMDISRIYQICTYANWCTVATTIENKWKNIQRVTFFNVGSCYWKDNFKLSFRKSEEKL